MRRALPQWAVMRGTRVAALSSHAPLVAARKSERHSYGIRMGAYT
jgi:hypothetical protein